MAPESTDAVTHPGPADVMCSWPPVQQDCLQASRLAKAELLKEELLINITSYRFDRACSRNDTNHRG